MKFPDCEGNFAGGRTEFGICGDKGGKLVLVIGGTLTDGCPIFLLFIGADGKGDVNEEGGVFRPGGSCEGLLYISPGGRGFDGCRGGRVFDGCIGGRVFDGCIGGRVPGGCSCEKVPGGWGA